MSAQHQINSDKGLQCHKRPQTVQESPRDYPTPYNRKIDTGGNNIYSEQHKQVPGICQCRILAENYPVQNDKPEIQWDFNIQSQAIPTQHSDHRQ